MSGTVKRASDIEWESVRKPFHYTLKLNPGEVFAFHEDVLPQYLGKTVKVTNAHFNAQDGFRTDGYLYGDGICHLASLINWAARTAQLSVVSKVNHDFADIPGIAREYGTSIYYFPGANAGNAQQNLYIENTLKQIVYIDFHYDEKAMLTVTIYTLF